MSVLDVEYFCCCCCCCADFVLAACLLEGYRGQLLSFGFGGMYVVLSSLWVVLLLARFSSNKCVIDESCSTVILEMDVIGWISVGVETQMGNIEVGIFMR